MSVWIVAAAGLTLTIVAWALFAARRRNATSPAPSQIHRIRVDGDYQPAEVHIRAGEPARLIFRREETALCSERVVFPDYGISVMLPPYEDVAVDLPASDAGEHAFTCQMQMLHGRLIVDREPRRSRSEHVVLAGTAGTLLFRAIGLIAAIPSP